jgi:hypothetical protein
MFVLQSREPAARITVRVPLPLPRAAPGTAAPSE